MQLTEIESGMETGGTRKLKNTGASLGWCVAHEFRRLRMSGIAVPCDGTDFCFCDSSVFKLAIGSSPPAPTLK
jgi:hypothetical protein